MLSHGNGEAFVDWCSRTLAPWQEDRFSSHAPFHFDLSILDIYLSIKHGGTLVLVGEEVGKEPLGLATLIAEKKISIWYSAPSILGLMAQYGKLESRDYSHLRMVLFAGEVFPIVHLRSLARQWPAPRYFNLYGPTETNVCTSYEVTLPIPEQRSEPYPIGAVCDHLQGMVVDAEGNRLGEREEGELCIAGANVMQGYWNLPEQTGRAFIVDGEGRRWYRTGDIVVRQADGDYRYVGRRDRMVKRRGYRVELGEIEACLYRHGDVREAAVVAVMDGQTGVSIRAHLSLGAGGKPSLIAFKRFCSEHLPLYMVPDRFIFQPALPKTSTAKVDYESLKGMG
jgi:acyl-coenzyme A synthetase/AMP-(fatty) acid ligase